MKKRLLTGIFTTLVLAMFAQTQIGRTTYDLQTNNANCRRMIVDPSGRMVSTYTRSNENTFNDRGTGYNYSSDNGMTWSESTFSTATFVRPDSSRTGWPNPVFTNTKEVIVSHFAGGNAVGLQVLRRDIGTTGPWEKIVLNSDNSTNPANNAFANDATWARAASRGDSIFVIFGLIDTDQPGIDGGLQMYRSIDAGLTWDGPNDIPLVNSSNFVANGGDAYALDMNSNGKIALVLGTYQVEVLTSSDWGNTFTKQTVVAINDINGNPAPLFDAQSGETMDTVNGPDRSYSILVDDNDQVHLWFGRTFTFKEEATTTQASFLPLEVGLMYWNDAMTEPIILHDTRIAAQQVGLPTPLYTGQVFDANGFGPQVNLYIPSLTSQPSAGYDGNGNLFVAYSALVPATFDDITDFASTNNVDPNGFHFRDIYLLTSSDNGATWDGPINVSNQSLRECVYPTVPRRIYGTDIPVMWQEDEIPGVNLQVPAGATHPVTVNEIIFTTVPFNSVITPADITAPTITQIDPTFNTLDAFVGCDIEFSRIFNNDDVPTGINVLDYQVLNPGALTTPGTYNVSVFVLDAAGNSSDTVDAVITIIADTQAPDLTLVGPATVDVLNGGTYTDPGLIISDNACDPTAPAIVTTDLDVNVDGTYTYTYTVTDNSGNVATIDRTVNVIGADVTSPEITPIGLASETIEACTIYEDPGVTAFDNIDFDVTDDVTFTGVVNPNVPGVYTISYSVTDNAGNVGTFDRQITVVDMTAPELTVSATGTVYVCKDGTFTAPMASATDCVTMNVGIVNDGNTAVNTAVNGVYQVTYTAEDDFNNISTETITVEVGEAPVPDFDIISNPGAQLVVVQDISTGNPNYWEWNWNNPLNTNNSFGQSSSHPYLESGVYEIELTVDNEFTGVCGTAAEALTISKSVTVSVGIAEVNALNAAVTIFPNPSNGLINVSIDDSELVNVEVYVYNVIGELVAKTNLENTKVNNTAKFDLGNDATGMYFVTISTEKATISKKVLVN